MLLSSFEKETYMVMDCIPQETTEQSSLKRCFHYSYFTLCILRIVLVLLPQTGYIHPDEHFQGPEVVYGDFLQLIVYRPWEFNSLNPIRNIVFPYFISGLPSLLIKSFGIKDWASFPYMLLVMPRLIMCSLSFLHDILLYNICVFMKKDFRICLLTYASSYVSLTFLTRTFSNCLESLFFSVLVYLLLRFVSYKNMLVDKGARLSNTPFVKLSFSLGLVTAVGVYNRPTFLCYCVFPVMYFLFHLIYLNIEKKQVLNNFISFAMGGLSILVSFTTIDTLYYNKIHYSLRDYHKINIISTPLNFLLYNSDSSNLRDHGLHPRFLHLLVNVPLLFSFLGILMNYKSLKYILNLNKVLKSCHDYKNIIILTYVVPLFLLSLIPHQEPRFILPLFFPVFLICTEFINTFNQKRKIVALWMMQNVFAAVFFGFFHQGGVYTASNFIHSITQNSTDYSVVFYKVYMPPRYILGLDDSRRDIQVSDFAGFDINKVESLLEETEMSKHSFLCFVVPQETTDQVINLPFVQSNFKFFKRKSFFPHFSTENLSDTLNLATKTVRSLFSSDNSNTLSLKEVLSINVLIFKSNK